MGYDLTVGIFNQRGVYWRKSEQSGYFGSQNKAPEGEIIDQDTILVSDGPYLDGFCDSNFLSISKNNDYLYTEGSWYDKEQLQERIKYYAEEISTVLKTEENPIKTLAKLSEVVGLYSLILNRMTETNYVYIKCM